MTLRPHQIHNDPNALGGFFPAVQARPEPFIPQVSKCGPPKPIKYLPPWHRNPEFGALNGSFPTGQFTMQIVTDKINAPTRNRLIGALQDGYLKVRGRRAVRHSGLLWGVMGLPLLAVQFHAEPEPFSTPQFKKQSAGVTGFYFPLFLDYRDSFYPQVMEFFKYCKVMLDGCHINVTDHKSQKLGRTLRGMYRANITVPTEQQSVVASLWKASVLEPLGWTPGMTYPSSVTVTRGASGDLEAFHSNDWRLHQ